jgi:hypothetical protein
MQVLPPAVLPLASFSFPANRENHSPSVSILNRSAYFGTQGGEVFSNFGLL